MGKRRHKYDADEWLRNMAELPTHWGFATTVYRLGFDA